jgi:hypothetical protein
MIFFIGNEYNAWAKIIQGKASDFGTYFAPDAGGIAYIVLFNDENSFGQSLL